MLTTKQVDMVRWQIRAAHAVQRSKWSAALSLIPLRCVRGSDRNAMKPLPTA
jgi:hypothetical protein